MTDARSGDTVPTSKSGSGRLPAVVRSLVALAFTACLLATSLGKATASVPAELAFAEGAPEAPHVDRQVDLQPQPAVLWGKSSGVVIY